MKNILLIGSRGNLGAELRKCFGNKDYRIFITSKNNCLNGEIHFDGTKPLVLPKNIEIDLLINAANEYYVDPNHGEIILMRNATIGIAENILLSDLSCPVLFFSSYLQYLPDELQPWSKYTLMKSEAVEIFREYGRNRKVSTGEITLYDNYGGNRRNKFFDLALDSIVNNTVLKATDGETVVNLTHIKDIVGNLKNIIDKGGLLSKVLNNFSFSIQTNDTFTLRKLVEYIERISGKRVAIEWGSIPYRTKEVFQYYDSKPVLPSFTQSQTLDSYIISRVK